MKPKSEWAIARNTILSAYRDFFYWLYIGQFPAKEIWNQFRQVINDGWLTIFWGSVVQGIFVMWLGGFYGDQFGGYRWLGTITVFGILREFSVLMSSVLFAARVGTAFTVEIGSMQMSEQISALKIMDVEPTTYLVIPRVLASTIALPVFVGFSFGVAIISSWILSDVFWDISFQQFFLNAFNYIGGDIIANSLTRSFIIGFVVSLNAVGLGFYPCDGAQELGRTTTKSIVINIFSLLLIDLIIGMTSTQISMGAPS